MNSIQKGRIAESQVSAALIQQGYDVFVPAFGNALCDLVAVSSGEAVRIEVKYCGSLTKNDLSWQVQLRQTRANKAVTTCKKFNAENSDVLAVYLASVERVVFFSAAELHDKSGLYIKCDADLDSLGRMAESGLKH